MNEMTTTIHDAKTHLSKYLVMLENREIDKLIIKRRDTEVGELTFRQPEKKEVIFGILEGQFEFDEEEFNRAKDEAIKDMEESIENTIRSLEEANLDEDST